MTEERCPVCNEPYRREESHGLQSGQLELPRRLGIRVCYQVVNGVEGFRQMDVYYHPRYYLVGEVRDDEDSQWEEVKIGFNSESMDGYRTTLHGEDTRRVREIEIEP